MTAVQIKAILFSLFSVILWHDHVSLQTRDELLQIRALPETLYAISRRNKKLSLNKQGCSPAVMKQTGYWFNTAKMYDHKSLCTVLCKCSYLQLEKESIDIVARPWFGKS